MKIFGKELKVNNFDVWHKGNLTKLSQLNNDVGFTKNALIQTVSNTAPSSPVKGQVWIQTL